MRDPDHSYCLHLERLAENKIKELEKQLEELNSPVLLSEWQKMEQQLATMREALEEGVDRFYLYDDEPAYIKMKAALLGEKHE